jgi:hypothetical protein
MESIYVLTIFLWVTGMSSATGGGGGLYPVKVEFNNRIECDAAKKLVGRLYGDEVKDRTTCTRKG